MDEQAKELAVYRFEKAVMCLKSAERSKTIWFPITSWLNRKKFKPIAL